MQKTLGRLELSQRTMWTLKVKQPKSRTEIQRRLTKMDKDMWKGWKTNGGKQNLVPKQISNRSFLTR